ncbi:MAG: DNA polymerase III subunit gamma/tau [Bacillota bacterium]
MYQALYRKWRPRTFDDVVGQEQVTETLKNQIATDRLSHAYLFIGTRGTGKTTCAKILAKAVNCENPENGNPCNKCRSCLGIDDGSIPDVVELDAASNNGVDNVRALRDEAIFSPAVVKKRVYIIDEVHMLSTSAFNALLKILEEPPAHLLFILATTELHKVPATILSRCQRHSFKRIAPDTLAKRIAYVAEREHMALEPDAAELLARLADGSLRDGLSLLDQCSGQAEITTGSVLSAMGLAGKLRIAELLDAISNGDTENTLGIFGGLWNDGKAPATLLGELSALLRDVLMTKVAPRGGAELLSGGFDGRTLAGFAKRMSAEALMNGLDALQAHIGSLRDGRDPKTTAELCLIGLCEPTLGDDVGTLKTRIARLEAALAEGRVLPPVTVAPVAAKATVAAEMPAPKAEQATPISEPELPPFDLEDREVSHIDNTARNNPERISTAESGADNIPPVSEEPDFPDEPPIKAQPVFTEQKAAPRVADASSASGGAWEEIVVRLKHTMQPGQYNIVVNPYMAQGELSGDELVIRVPSAFVKNQLEQAPVMACIKAAAQEVAGAPLRVRIDESKPAQAGSAEKLDSLSKFGNVKFE